jgi:protocatechuate 3,4-dioxygenase beta subunit
MERPQDDRPMSTEHTERRLRRRELAGLAAGGLAAAGVYALTKGDGDSTAATATRQAPDCLLTPELTEGPYYLPSEPFRRNITERRPGYPLILELTVVDADTCKPLEGASVEIWHADATGNYSGFGATASNRTFLRGQQRCDKDGVAVFQTIYPGWYQGRTTHIHVKVHVRGSTVHTGQLFFSDGATARVNANKQPYAQRGQPDVTNGEDGIYAQGGSGSVVRLRRRRKGKGLRGALTMGVNA